MITSLMRFHLVLRLADGTTYKTHTAKRKRISLRLMGENYTEADLRVLYYRDGVEIGQNRGIYHNQADALLAWEAFADAEVVG